MKPSLFGLGLLAPTACLAQVVETVWVGIGDCSSSGDLGGSGAGDSDDGFGTKIHAYTSTNPKNIVTTGIQTSMYPIVPAHLASGTTTVFVTSTDPNGTVHSLITTSTYPIIPSTGSPQPSSTTVESEITSTNSQGSDVLATSTYIGIINATTVLSTDTGSFPTPTLSLATTGSPTTATNSGAEPTYSNVSPTCGNNNTYYVDRFGLRYDIRCGLNLNDVDVSLQAHADTFEGCIQYCTLLKSCAGVSFQDKTCNPIFTFRGYRPEIAAAGTDLLTAVPTVGQNNGSVTPDDLCAEGFDGQSYTDKFQCTWIIYCDQTIGGTALQQTIQTNFEACINYCAFYEGCESVYFDGTGGSASSQANASANCFPMSSIGIVSQDIGFSAASLQGTCNVSSLVPALCDCICLYLRIVDWKSVRCDPKVHGWISIELLIRASILSRSYI